MAIITTNRLRVEPLTTGHADVMYPLLLDERIYVYLSEEPPASADALRKRYELLSSGRSPDGSDHWLNWILLDRGTEQPIGSLQATVRANGCSVAYVLNPRFWGQGYATEAARAVITHLFNSFEIPAVTAEIHPRNAASRRLVERLGFSLVGHDADADDDLFEITRADWLSRNPAPS